MATLYELVEAGKLKPVAVRLDSRNEFPVRTMFGTPEFHAWLRGPLKSAEAFYPTYPTNIRPAFQALDLIKRFITGKPFDDLKLFKRMTPQSDDVWEFSTADVRLFGWFVKQDCYIAVKGDLFGNLKNDKSLYEKHRLDCRTHRSELDLDSPKYVKGGRYRDVISD